MLQVLSSQYDAVRCLRVLQLLLVCVYLHLLKITPKSCHTQKLPSTLIALNEFCALKNVFT